MRILPKTYGLYDDNWISDKSRYAFDGLKNYKINADVVCWEDFIIGIGERLTLSLYSQDAIDELKGPFISTRLGAVVGSLCDLQGVYFTAQFIKSCGGTDIQVGNLRLKANYDLPSFYSLNKTIAGLNNLNTLILVGLNTRLEASVLNTSLRKHQLNRGLNFLTIGAYSPLKLRQKHVGTSVRTLIAFSENKLKNLLNCYLDFNPSIFYSFESLRNKHGYFLQNVIRYLGKKLFIKTLQGERLGVVHSNISTLNFANIGIYPGVRSPLHVDIIKDKEISTLFLIQLEQFKEKKWLSTSNYTHTIGMSTNSTISSFKYDTLIPISNLYEKEGFLYNIEGRLRKLNKVVSTSSNSRSLENFLTALTLFQDVNDEYTWESIWDFEEEIHLKSQLEKIIPTFLVNIFIFNNAEIQSAIFPFAPNIYNFYLNDIISLNSRTMGECALFFNTDSNFIVE